ncbi:putative Ig domain-containing protein [Mucilaginibacter sp. HD30]
MHPSFRRIAQKTLLFLTFTYSSFAAKVDFETATGAYNLAIVGLNGHGKADLAVATNGSSSVSLLFNGAKPAFPVPSIQYANSKLSYTATVAVPAISPVNNGGAVPAMSYGQTSAFSGGPVAGSANGPVGSATFSGIWGLAFNQGVLYAGDNYSAIRKISDGTVSNFTSAGAGEGMAFDATGNMYVAVDTKINKITPAGVISIFAGSATRSSVDGTGTAATFNGASGIAIDAQGNLFVSEQGGRKIRKITPAGVVTTFAGSGVSGGANGTGTAATFRFPTGLSFDAAGNLYVADVSGQAIRKITPAGEVTTLAGSGAPGNADGWGASATFTSPYGITYDAVSGDLLVACSRNIRRVSVTGRVTTISGSGTAGIANGEGNTATFTSAYAVALDGAGDLYVAESNTIRKVSMLGYSISPALPAGLVFDPFTGAISGTPKTSSAATNYIVTAANAGGISQDTINITVNGFPLPSIQYANSALTYTVTVPVTGVTPVNSGGAIPTTGYGQTTTFSGGLTSGSVNGPVASATFGFIWGLAFNQGILYAGDNYTAIRKISGGTVSNFTTSGAGEGMAFDAAGNMYVAVDTKINKITPAGVISTFAGNATSSSVDGTGTAATFNGASGIAIDAQGNLFVSEQGGRKIRKITPAGVVTTFAGSGVSGGADGTGTAATFRFPSGLAFDAAGNLYVADVSSQAIRKITPTGVVSTLAGSGAPGNTDGWGASATFTSPYGISYDNVSGDLFVVCSQKIRRVSTAGRVTTVSGTGSAGNVNGNGHIASFTSAYAVALDGAGSMYVAQPTSIRKVSMFGYGISPALPAGLVFDAATGAISGTPSATAPATNYVITAANAGGISQDTINITVKGLPVPAIQYANSALTYTATVPVAAISPVNNGGAVPAMSYGQTSAFSGGPVAGSANGPVGSATFGGIWGLTFSQDVLYAGDNYAAVRKISGGTVSNFTTSGAGEGMAFDAAGNMYVAVGNLIKRITPAGVVSTFAGNATSSSVDGTGTAATFNGASGIAIDAQGNLFVSEQGGRKIRKITPGRVVTTFAGSGVSGGADGTGTAATFRFPTGLAFDAAGNLYVADVGSQAIRKITPAGVVTTLAGSGITGNADGWGASASFTEPYGITYDVLSGDLLVACSRNIRRVSIAGRVTTVSGSGIAGTANGEGNAAGFKAAYAVALDGAGSLYVSEGTLIRKVSMFGYGISPALPAGLVFDPATGAISGTPKASSTATNYIVTAANAGGISQDTITITVNAFPVPSIQYANSKLSYTATVAVPAISPVNNGGAVPAMSYGQTSAFSGGPVAGSANGPVGSATFSGIWGLAFNQGVLYAGDNYSAIRKISDGTVSNFTSAGAGEGMAFDATGNMYVAVDTKINKITPAGVISIFAGSATRSSVDGTGTAATFNGASGIAIDAQGNLFVSEQGGRKIRKITPAGVVTTFAGSGVSGGANGTGTAATFRFPTGLSFDAAGNLYVADVSGQAIRKITPAGEVTTLAGSGAPGNADGWGASATFTSPYGITYDAVSGDLLVACSRNIRRVSVTGRVTTISGSGTAGIANGEGNTATFTSAYAVALDGAGDLYVAESNTIRKVSMLGYSISPALPAGLVFDPFTGAISGTPKTSSAATNYIVTAANAGGISQDTINITVNVASSDKAITTFGLTSPATTAFVNETDKTIAMTVPSGTNLTALVPVFTTSGASVKIDTVIQVSGVTAVNFSSPVTYTVKAADLTSQTYLVTVNMPPVPPNQSSRLLSFTNITATSATVSWTNGNGVKRAVFIAKVSGGVAAPVANTSYLANTTFGSGTQIGTTGWYCVYNGSGNTTDVTGLEPYSTYRLTVVDYNGAAATEQYLLTGLSPANVATASSQNVLPTISARLLTFSNTTYTTTAVNWISGNGARRAVFVAQASGGVAAPANSMEYTANTAFGSGKEIGTTGWYCVYDGTGSAANISGLLPYKTYRVTVVEYNGASISTKYLLTGLSPASVLMPASPLVAPTVPSLKLTFTNTVADATTVSWTNGNGATRAVFIAKVSGGVAAPVGNTSYLANTTFGSGTQIGTTGWYCVYNGSGNTTDVTGLEPYSTYRLTVVDYNGAAATEQYLLTGLSPANVATASSQNVLPTISARLLTFSNTTYTTTAVNWISGNGARRAVFVAQASGGVAAPANSMEYTANTAFGSGKEIGTTGWYCVYDGTGSAANISGLLPYKTYRVTVVEYNGASISTKYLLTGLSPASVLMPASPLVAPTVPSLKLTFTNTVADATTVSWTNGNGATRAVFIAKVSGGVINAVDNTSYTASTTFAGGTQIGATGWYCIYNGTGSSANVAGLLPNSTYRVTVIEYNGTTGAEKYMNTMLNPASVVTLPSPAVPPTVPSLKLTFTNTTMDATTVNWISGSGSRRAVFVARTANGVITSPDNITYAANGEFSLGMQVGNTGWYCVYNGTGNNAFITGLTVLTNYRVTVIEYNGLDGAEKYMNTMLNPATFTTTANVPRQAARASTFDNESIASGITVHQAVSPNGDGVNDVLTIDGILNYPDNTVSIINKSGVQVFSIKGYDNVTKVFDGSSSNGSKLLPGTYFYSVDYKEGAVTKHTTGYLVLKY